MLWLQPSPWGRWLAAASILALAVVVEFRPDAMVDHPFATENIPAGEAISELNTEMRRVPKGLMPLPEPGAVARRLIPEGSPVTAADTGPPQQIVPAGWWMVEMDVPRSAGVGDTVSIVLLDSGRVVTGVVVSTSSPDAFDPSPGAVAVETGSATEVAVAAAIGRVVVLVSTG